MSDKHIIELTRRQRAGSIFWSVVAVIVGWTLYVYWWAKVLAEEKPRELMVLLLLIVLSSMVLLALVLGWIWHNRRLARRGVRGAASRYEVPVFQQDALGREMSLPQPPLLRNAAIVTIEATRQTKTFSTEVSTES